VVLIYLKKLPFDWVLETVLVLLEKRSWEIYHAKMLAKDFAPDVISQEKIFVGFLRQDIDFEQGRTVLEEAMKLLQILKL
jgi:hypothetical protein